MPDTRTMKMERADASPASAFDAERHPASAELEAREAPRDRDSEARESPQTSAVEPAASPPRRESTPEQRRRRALPFIVTAIAVVVAGVLGGAMWNAYMGGAVDPRRDCALMSSPWHRRLPAGLSSCRSPTT